MFEIQDQLCAYKGLEMALAQNHPDLMGKLPVGKAGQIIERVVDCLTLAKTLNDQAEHVFVDSVKALCGTIDSDVSGYLAVLLIQEDESGREDDFIARCVSAETLKRRIGYLNNQLGMQRYAGTR